MSERPRSTAPRKDCERPDRSARSRSEKPRCCRSRRITSPTLGAAGPRISSADASSTGAASTTVMRASLPSRKPRLCVRPLAGLPRLCRRLAHRRERLLQLVGRRELDRLAVLLERDPVARLDVVGLAAGDHLLSVAVVDDDPPRDEVAPVPRLAAAAGQLREHRGRVHAGGRRLEADRQPTPVDEPAAVLGRDLLERELVARRTRHWLPPLRTGRRLRRRHGTQYDPAVQNNARSDERLATPTTA